MLPSMQDSVVLSPLPSGAIAARHFVDDTLRRWGRSDLTDIAGLLSSELVTNVILHARTDMVVDINLDDERLLVAVSDTSDEPAQQKNTVGPLDGHGYGLQLVDALSTSWGVNAEGSGKTVWFELAAPTDLDTR
jgi:anti-sigma regulatory factor (Ser/Thr protein kinase)